MLPLILYFVIITLFDAFLAIQEAVLEFIKLRPLGEAGASQRGVVSRKIIGDALFLLTMFICCITGQSAEPHLPTWPIILLGSVCSLLIIPVSGLIIWRLLGIYNDYSLSRAKQWFVLGSQILVLVLIILAVLL